MNDEAHHALRRVSRSRFDISTALESVCPLQGWIPVDGMQVHCIQYTLEVSNILSIKHGSLMTSLQTCMTRLQPALLLMQRCNAGRNKWHMAASFSDGPPAAIPLSPEAVETAQRAYSTGQDTS